MKARPKMLSIKNRNFLEASKDKLKIISRQSSAGKMQSLSYRILKSFWFLRNHAYK